MDRITIIGLGLIGGSIGLALKKVGLRDIEIMGHDIEHNAMSTARRRGAVDKTDWNLIGAVRDAGLVIIATPVLTIKEVLRQTADYLPEGAVITDTGSTKGEVVQWAEQLLPPTVSFIGGHPLAGKETSGIDAAEVDLFKDCVYCLTPTAKAPAEAVGTVVSLARLIGARTFFLDPFEHDGLVAGVSHLPIILSAALVRATAGSSSWREMAKLASSGYRDLSRLASGDPTMSRDICSTNRQSIARWIDQYIENLKYYRDLVVQGNEGLLAEFTQAFEARERWLKQPVTEEQPLPEIPSAGERMSAFFMGERLARRSEEIMRRLERDNRS